MNPITDLLSKLKVGEPQTFRNMKVYPIHVANGHARSYQTLDEAMADNIVQVQEISEGGSVPTLAVHNTGRLPVLLVIGEELIGAKQNRVLNTTLLVPAETQMQIPVSCVERGRWSYRSEKFSSSDTSSHMTLRMHQTDSVTRNLRARADYDANQGEVWAEVERKISSHDTISSTRALSDVYARTDEQVKDYLEAFNAPESQGMLVAINDVVVGGDIFDHHETLQKLWPKLVRSYSLDALERSTEAESKTHDPFEPAAFLDAARSANGEPYELVGLGTDIRISSDLIWDDHVIHASLFNKSAVR